MCLTWSQTGYTMCKTATMMWCVISRSGGVNPIDIRLGIWHHSDSLWQIAYVRWSSFLDYCTYQKKCLFSIIAKLLLSMTSRVTNIQYKLKILNQLLPPMFTPYWTIAYSCDLLPYVDWPTMSCLINYFNTLVWSYNRTFIILLA